LACLCFSLTIGAQNAQQQVKQLFAKYDSLYNIHEYKEACVVLEEIMDIEREQHRLKMKKGSDRLTQELHNEELARLHNAKEQELRTQHDKQTESERLRIQLQGESALAEAKANQAKLKTERMRDENERKNDELVQLREQIEANSIYKQVEYNRFISNVSWLVGVVAFILIILAAWWAYRNRKARKRLGVIIDNLQIMRNQASEANRMKNIFVQNMSHDIRTPLNAIMGFSQIIATPEIPITSEEREEFGNHILNSTNMLTMLVDDILNISDIESGNYAIKQGRHRLNFVGRRALSCIEFRVSENIQVGVTSEVDDEYMINCDSQRVQQILLNFLTNAVKHTTEGEINIHISVDEAAGTATFAVTDTGTGVPPELAEQIFERFSKLNDFIQGSGIGLNICRILSEKMGGRVYLDTSYTRGACFKLEIPLGGT